MPELRKKMLFVIMIIILYRLGAVIPVPFISSDMLNFYLNQAQGSIFQYFNILSGQAFSKATLFALSITPYINSSIIMQLLTIAIPALEKMQKSGEEGRKNMRNAGVLTAEGRTLFGAVVIIACYSAGSALIMWMGEKINENGIGNGISLILFANIVSGGLSMLQGTLRIASSGVIGIILAILTLIGSLAIVTFVVFITNSERRLPVQYAKRVVGRKMYGGQSSNLPIKLNMSGVMPIIFANSIVALPSTIAILFPAPKEGTFWFNLLNFLSYKSWFYALMFFVLIILFSFFYTSISFNPVEIANNLKSNGGFIPGIRPGKPTADYITKILNRITLLGAIFLGIIAVAPLIVNLASNFALGGIAFGGSSLLIVVGVALETAREIQAQMTLRHYKGFLE